MAAPTTAQRTDPYRSFNFVISLVDSSNSTDTTLKPAQSKAAGGFSECSGLEMSLDVEEYKEGGNNATILKFPTRMKWTNLKLKRGLTANKDLWDWHYGFVHGKVVRKDGIVTLQDEQQNPVRQWSFTRGLPIKWAGPSFNATQNSVAIEELEITHEGLKLL
jgi:phage tail-like protein